MADIRRAHAALLAAIVEGEAHATRALRLAAFRKDGVPESLRVLVDKVCRSAHTVDDADFAAARASGLDEDQIFEIVVCAAVGQSTRQRDAALAALDAATRKE